MVNIKGIFLFIPHLIRTIVFVTTIILLYSLISICAIIVSMFKLITKLVYRHEVIIVGHRRHNLEKIAWLKKNIKPSFWRSEETVVTLQEMSVAKNYLQTRFYFLRKEDAVLFKLVWYDKDNN